MPDKVVWEIEPHTRAKHELLRRYLGAWFPILASSGRHKRILFIDGFAGPGVYSGGELGSPLIALNVLIGHPHFERWQSTEFKFAFVESDANRHSSLESEVETFWKSVPDGKPSNVVVHVVNAEFVAVAKDIISDLSDRNKQLAPTLAFIDPFGWSGVPLTVIRDLLSFDRCEVLFNFMFDAVNRWVADERPGIATHFNDLFGSEEREHARAAGMSGDVRKAFLSALYMHQLQEVAGFDFVRKFEMVDSERGRTAYFLMFGTRHRKGLSVMKDAMWALDPVAGVRFAGSAGAQEMLFEPEPDFGPLREAIRVRFMGETVSVEDVERFVIDETDYKVTHCKKQVLRPFEESGELECLSPRKRRFTYPAGVQLRFMAAEAE
jgi:three-Cys-motif partner protein